MHRQLLTHIDVLATMDNGGDNGGDKGCGRELTDAAVLIDGNVITKVGPTSALEDEAAHCDEVHNLA